MWHETSKYQVSIFSSRTSIQYVNRQYQLKTIIKFSYICYFGRFLMRNQGAKIITPPLLKMSHFTLGWFCTLMTGNFWLGSFSWFGLCQRSKSSKIVKIYVIFQDDPKVRTSKVPRVLKILVWKFSLLFFKTFST